MITSTITAQNKEREKTLFTDPIGSVDITDVVFANQIFIEHKSLFNQVNDLNEVIRVIRMELAIEKNDGVRLRDELKIYKELDTDRRSLYKINETVYKNTISDLKSNNLWYKIVAILSTLTTVFVVITK